MTISSEQTLIVLSKPKYEDRSLFLVPVASDTLEDACPVMQRMSHDVHIGFSQRNIRTFEECTKIADGVWRRLGSAQ